MAYQLQHAFFLMVSGMEEVYFLWLACLPGCMDSPHGEFSLLVEVLHSPQVLPKDGML